VTALGPVITRLGGQLEVRPRDGEAVIVRVTVPVKPPIGVTVIVELPVAPVLKSAGEVAEIEKSIVAKVNVATVEWDAVPGEPTPSMFTLKEVVMVEVHERLAVPVPFAERETVADGLNAWHVKPEGTISVRATEPAKLNVLVRVIVEEIDEPAAPLGLEALIVKSPT
jgi:hypothetical protein